MTIIDKVRSWFATPEPEKQPEQERSISFEQGAAAGLTLEPTLAGVSLTNEKALTVSSFYVGARHIIESIASLPVRVMVRQKDGGKLPAEDHPVTYLLNCEPNAYQTKSDYWEWVILQLLLYGNVYSKLDILNSGRASALHPIQARFMQVSWQMPMREITYHVTESPYTVAEDLSAYECAHCKGISLDSIIGINPNELWRESVATSIALERYSASFFGQGCRPSGVVKVQGMLSDKARMNLKESWKRAYSGTSQTGAVPILEEGQTFEPMSSNNDEFQMIESKGLQIRAMANWNKITPTKCGDLSRATWSNIESENQSFISNTLAPIIHKIEQEYTKKCLLPSERNTMSIEFDVSGLLRGDSKTRFANYMTACGGPVMTVNECRLQEGLPPIEGGDELRTPLNQGPATPEPAQQEETDVPGKEEQENTNQDKDAN